MTSTMAPSLRAIPASLSKTVSRASNLIAFQKRLLLEDSSFFWMQNVARLQQVRHWGAPKKPLARLTEEQINQSPVRLDSSLQTVHQTFQQDGYYQGIWLRPKTLEALLNFAYTSPRYGDRDANISFLISEREAVERRLGLSLKLASYFDSHESCPAFQQIKQDPLVIAIAAQHLGHTPIYSKAELLWSFPRQATQTEKIASAQVLHCDINDYRTVKFFFYLTEVDLTSGPHVYIKGSHRNRSLLHQLMGQGIASIPDEKLTECYGPDRVTPVCGPAGFGFAGDPYVLHRGTTPSQKPRLMLQLEYTINTYKTWYFPMPAS